jgi:uncharacterized protein (DUF2267 family)
VTASYPATFSQTLQKTQAWLRDLSEELGWEDEHKAYLALRAVFKLLSRRITKGEIEDIKHVLPKELASLWP